VDAIVCLDARECFRTISRRPARSIRSLATTSHPLRQIYVPHTPAVIFLGVIDGEHKCRPATEAEIIQSEGKFSASHRPPRQTSQIAERRDAE